MLGGTTISLGPNFFVAGPILGAPMAVMALEILIGGGAKEIVYAGFGGALGLDLNCGDYLFPHLAFSAEGTSTHYGGGGTFKPDSKLYSKLQKAADANFHSGAIFSTDGPFRETQTIRRDYENLGALAVDMEVSAVMAAATFREIALAAVVLITDSFARGTWEEGLNTPKFKTALTELGPILWKALGAPKIF
jgi:uridine phosphorylase